MYILRLIVLQAMLRCVFDFAQLFTVRMRMHCFSDCSHHELALPAQTLAGPAHRKSAMALWLCCLWLANFVCPPLGLLGAGAKHPTLVAVEFGKTTEGRRVSVGSLFDTCLV